MPNAKQLSLIRQGPKIWNQWRKDNPIRRVELQEANLQRIQLRAADLRKADLSKANLREADLRGADLSEANLRRADLRGADLSEANLRRVDLRGADLSEANLRRADLRGANLIGTMLVETILSKAELGRVDHGWVYFSTGKHGGVYVSERLPYRTGETGTVFGNVDLSQVIGLAQVAHNGPSIVYMDTFYKSAGNIPESFLRGCGLSDLQITMVKLHRRGQTYEETSKLLYDIHQLIVLGAIHSYSSFISYSMENEDFANKIHDDLQRNGVRCWFAKKDMPIGGKLRDEIDRAISRQENIVLILSEHAISSGWVEDELERAFEVEKERGTEILLPIRLDDAVLESEQGWARKVRRRLIGDFCNWKDEKTYKAEFQKLLQGIKATAEEGN